VIMENIVNSICMQNLMTIIFEVKKH